MARIKYSCDFETTTSTYSDSKTRLWAWGTCEIDDINNLNYGNTIDSFLKWCEETQGDCYFHNLKFDGSFIINKLMKMGYEYSSKPKPYSFNTVISAMGQWYMIDIFYGYDKKGTIEHTVIYDSLKKLPFPVRRIATAFKLDMKKGDIDYHKLRGENYVMTDDEESYLKNDIQIVAQALQTQFEQGLNKMTAGSDALNDFKHILTKKEFKRNFPVLHKDLDEDIRQAYKGGFTWVNPRIQGKDIKEGIVYDVNSLYPSVMLNHALPVGTPIAFSGEYVQDDDYPVWTQKIRCQFELKKDHIPTIQIKNNIRLFKPNEYLTTSDGLEVELHVSSVDWKLIQEHYDLYNVEYLNGFKYQVKKGLFDNYINKWNYVKITSTGAMRELAKLMLNSLYGKFGTNPKVTGKVPYLKDDGSNGFRMENMRPAYDLSGKPILDKNGNQKYKGDKDLEVYRDPVYIPMGVFITSYARDLTIRTAQACYDRICYCDTDSIHLEGTETPKEIEHMIHDKNIGMWGQESVFKKARFIRQKTYIERVCYTWVMKDGEFVYDEDGKQVARESKFIDECDFTKDSVKCAGMPDSIKYVSEKDNEERVKQGLPKITKPDFSNFYVGFRSWGKLKPKQVDGGVLLVDESFEIK